MGKGRLGMIISAITVISTIAPVAIKGAKKLKAAKGTSKAPSKSQVFGKH